MSDQRIRDALNGIEPSDTAKQRMYQNILKKAEQETQRTEKPAKKPARFLRYALPAAACFGLLIAGMIRFLPGDAPELPDEFDLQGGNPFVEAEGPDAFRELGIALEAPDGADNASYAVIDGRIAQINFEADGQRFTVRASAQAGDFSGIAGEEVSSESIDAENSAVLVTVRVDSLTYYKIVWTDGKVNYCLYGEDASGGEQIKEIYAAMTR